MRKQIKRQILRQWAENDPSGLLIYLDSRPWLSGQSFSSQGAGEDAFKKLAKTNPDYLLHYAKEHGCFSALSALSDHGNPYSTLHLYLAQDSGSIPPDSFRELFEAAGLIDPEFYRNIISIEEPEVQVQAFQGVSEILFKQHQYQAYFETLKKIHTAQNSTELVLIIADNLITNYADVGLIHSLPEELQDLAIKKTIHLAADVSYPPSGYKHAFLNTCIENNWIASFEEEAKKVISSDFDDSDAKAALAWKTWALELPNNRELTPLRDTAIRTWILSNPDQWRTIHELPSQTLRDIAYTAVLHEINLEKEADSISWIKAQIQDPALRKSADQAIQEREEDLFEDDPFAYDPVSDPFNP